MTMMMLSTATPPAARRAIFSARPSAAGRMMTCPATTTSRRLASSSSSLAVPASDRRRGHTSERMTRATTSSTMTGIGKSHSTSFASSLRSFASASADLPYHTVVGMPALSPTMESGTISKWNVSEGDAFSAGDSLAIIETDKASMDFEAQDEGVVAKLLVGQGGGEVKCGSPIMVTVEDAADVGAFANFTPAIGKAAPPAAAVVPTPPTPPPAAAASAALASGRRPSIQFLGKEGWAAKLSTSVPPPGVVVSSAPVVATSAASPPPPPAAAIVVPILGTYPPESVTTVPPDLYTDSPASNMRKVISKRLTQSKSTVPHFYASIEVPLDNILALRKVLAKDYDAKVSVNDFIIKASAMALRDVPEVNATYDVKTSTQRTFDAIDVSVAVATPTGLITPIIPSTSGLTLSEIGSRMKDLASRARDGKLKPEEYQGGTFCISNLGMFGISEFSAVINPPQGAILAVGGGERRVVPGNVDAISGEKGRPVISTVMTARLSADRRVVDEATAALFMGALKEYLTQPKLMML
jgi:pyruvate dehydrogenase E2 component (dihydrolipoamide acetyltransferase)